MGTILLQNGFRRLRAMAMVAACSVGFGLAQADPPTPWPKALTQYYMVQCEHGLRQQGDGPTKAATLCRCMSGALSQEFGMEGFDHLRTARLDPNGSFHDQRFFRISQTCYRAYANPVKRLN